MKTLRDVKIGETVTVVKLHGEGAVKRRIMDMGITKGTSVFVRKVAPLGDPVEVTVRNYELSLRKADAEMTSSTHLMMITLCFTQSLKFSYLRSTASSLNRINAIDNFNFSVIQLIS